MLSVEPVLENLLFRVEFVQDHIGVGLVAGCEHDYLKLGRHPFQKTDRVGSDVDPDFHGILLIKFDGEFQVRLRFVILVAVDQCLIQIQD